MHMSVELPVPISLAGRTAVVTGGGGVLCGYMSKVLGRAGAKVAVLDLRAEAAQTVAREITADGGTAMGVAANVLDRPALEQAAEEIERQLGPPDILVNGAGGNHKLATTSKERLEPGDLRARAEGVVTFFDLDPKGIEFVFNLNFLGTLLPTQVFARRMAERGGGVIVNISSMNAFKPLTKIPAYSAAKAAVSNFTQWLAVHLAPVRVRVNAIAPGFFLADQNRALLTREDGSLTPRGQTIIQHTPMGRFGNPEDLGGALLFLCSDRASGFVNGVVLPVDGGFSAFSGV
jgi:NAD(P)-dependent dehydrogenase (short-subunit alcohol dehydrogenase family)